jgi:hypothetical protein
MGEWAGMLRTSIRWAREPHKYQQINDGDVGRSDFTGSRSHSGMGRPRRVAVLGPRRCSAPCRSGYNDYC